MIDTLSFFISLHPEIRLDSDHSAINQVIVGNLSYYVKRKPESFEVHEITPAGVVLREDHSDDSAPYSWSNGLWMRAQMSVGDEIHNQGNIATYYAADCSVSNRHAASFTNGLIAHDTYDFGGDIGKVEAIVIGYHKMNHSFQEWFCYAKGWGWTQWIKHDHNGNVINQTIWNRISKEAPLQPSVKACFLR